MWLQYLDFKKSGKTGLWSARKKCYCHNGHFTYQWSGFPRCSNWWDECASTIPGPNTEQKKLPPYSPFLNIEEQAISPLKAAIKADISHPEIQEQMNNREEAIRQGIALGNYRTQLLQHALQTKCWYHYGS